ncbi:hypothetical protein B0H14DRAFT_2625597 [Mycena olivaceomarginata]|nr:hypothetical protein B0H14DRAFT_2625597 [Mycena olivaceomarginata]
MAHFRPLKAFLYGTQTVAAEPTAAVCGNTATVQRRSRYRCINHSEKNSSIRVQFSKGNSYSAAMLNVPLPLKSTVLKKKVGAIQASHPDLQKLVLDLVNLYWRNLLKWRARGALVPSEIHRTTKTIFYRSRKVCKEINAIQLSAAQILIFRLGNVRPPETRRAQPQEYGIGGYIHRCNPHVADILAAFDHNYPVIESFMQFFANKMIDIHREAGDWMRSLCLVLKPELEAVLTEPLGNLLKR